MNIPKPTINHLLNIVLITALLFSTLCSNPTVIVKSGVSTEHLNHALKTQKEAILQQVELKIEENAFKNIDNIRIAIGDTSKREDLRAIAFKALHPSKRMLQP